MPRRSFRSGTAFFLIAGCLATVSLVSVAGESHAATGDATRSEAFYKDAEKYLAKGNADAAVIQLKNALQKDPYNIAARRLLGKIYLMAGIGAYAEKELRTIIERGVNDKEVHLMLAEAFLLQGKYDDVLSEIEDDSSDPVIRAKTLLMRARAHLGLRRLDHAEEAFSEADRLEQDGVQAKVGLARILILRNKRGEAEEMIDTALAIKPEQVRALVVKAELRRLSQDLEGAVALFDKAISGKSTDLPARLGRAAALVDLKREADARADIDVILARYPRHPLANYLSALVHTRKKDFASAQEALQNAGSLLDDHLPALFLSGAIHYALNQMEQAVHKLTRYVALVPRHYKAVKLLAATLMRSNEPKRVIELLEPLVEKGFRDPQFLTMMGIAYMRVGDFNKGTALFEKAAEAAPNVAAIRTQLALSRLASGQSDRAIDDLETAIDLDPEKRRTSLLLALVQLRQGKFDDALASAESLRAKIPDNPLIDNLIGAARLGKGETATARDSFERALKTNPDYHPARMNLAQIDLRENKFDAASAHFERVLEKNTKHVGAMLGLATIAAKNKQRAETMAWLKQASRANPASILPRLGLIRHHSQAREFEKAVVVAREMVQANPRNPRALEALGSIETALGDHVSAAATFNRLTDRVPNSAKAFALLAKAQMAAKDGDSARQSFEKAISLNENYIAGYVALAKLEASSGKPEAALKTAKLLQEKHPGLAEGFVIEGTILLSIEKYADAIKAYEAGMEKKNGKAAVLGRFTAQRKAGQEKEAFIALQEWTDRKGDHAMRYVLANAYLKIKRHDDAIREFEKLLAADRVTPVMLNNLAWLYGEKGNDRAVAVAEKALKRAPGSAAVMDTAGWILVRNDQIERGTRLLEKASNLAPKQGDIVYHYAAALEKSGRSDEARRTLRKLLGSGIGFAESGKAEELLKQLGG